MNQALADLRRTRRAHRLGDLEWFDLAYRVYLAAFLGGGAVIILSGFVGDEPATPSQLASVFGDGPAVLGVLAMAAVAIGLRSGADGGPLSVESADVRHLLLAPIDRRQVLMRPLAQRMRAVAFGAALLGAIAGELAAQRLPGSPVAWATSGAGAAVCAVVLAVALATIAHAVRLPRWLATVLGVVLVGVQLVAVATDSTGPGNPFGHLALWGADQPMVGLIAIALAVVAAVIAFLVVGRLRVEPLVRRGELVSQLRFAVTMQDLRTVVLLRRQLSNELPRRRPWLGRGWDARRSHGRAEHLGVTRGATSRGVRGVARTPASRLARMALVAIVTGRATVAVLRDTTPALVIVAGLLLLIGLDLIEPLSQEIDHPGLTDALPVERGRLHLHLLVAPMLLAIPFALIGAATVALLEPDAAAAAFALAVPITWVGMAGSIVNAVRDSSTAATTDSVMVPPEFAGMGNALRALIPVIVSGLATIPILAAREQPEAATVFRSLIGLGLVIAGVAWWVRRREKWRASWRAFLEGART